VVRRKTTKRSTQSLQPEAGGRLQQLVDAGDTHELARRSMTLQNVMLDLHRQLASAESQADLARTMALALTGSFACERLAVLRRVRGGRGFESVAEIGDVPATLHESAPALALRLAPFLPHMQPLTPLLPPFSEAVAEAAQALVDQGFVRAAWLNVEKQIDWLVLVGPKLSGNDYDEFDISLLRATLDAAFLACSRLLLVDALEERNRELVTANRRLLQIDDLKTAILFGVSHELRTPLTRILSYAEALRDGEAGAGETTDFLNVIVRNTHHLATRIDDALRFAELIGGRVEPQRQPVQLHELVEEAVANHAAAAAEAQVGLAARCEPLAVISDASWVRMILKCLIDNAVKFTPAGGEVCVELAAVDAGAAVRVVDSGPGIPDEARERIWQLFEHGDVSLRRPHHGLGLGLALAQRLASELGVRLELVHSSAAGSVFGIHFPDAAASTAVAPATSRATVASLRR
jgi:signal transduction histidine kinase